MNTIITIAAIVVLVIVIVIAISGSRNLKRFYNNMDNIYDKAWKDAGEYAKRLMQDENRNTDFKGELSSD